jgi:hypothetical protein
MKPETRCARLVAKMAPLADWLVKNRPSVTVMRITPDDMALLNEFPKEAFSAGIIQKDGSFFYNGYMLKQTAGTVYVGEPA